MYKTCYLQTIPLVIHGFGPFLVAKRVNSKALLIAVLVFVGYSWDKTTANNKGRLYLELERCFNQDFAVMFICLLKC